VGQLTLANLRKSFGVSEVIKGVDLSVVDKEFVVFVGPSGCGKSTLLRMIAGLEEATAGDIIIDGRKVDKLPPVQRGIAMVFQSYALYPHMTVFENIAFPLRVERRPQAEIEQRVGDAARILQLETRLQQKPGTLSGGQRQRVAIGRAIVRQPEIFLFDEPLSNLDAALRSEMRIELTRLHKDLGATMIYVTHDQVEAMTMADKIVVLNKGVIAQVGSPLELYHKPTNSFVATFIGNPKMNFLSATCTAVDADTVTVKLADGGTLRVPVKAPADTKGKTLQLGIRPEHCQLEGGEVRLDIVPSVIEQLGLHTLVYTALDGGKATSFCCLLPGNARVAEGLAMSIGIDGADCHLFDAEGHAFEREVDLTPVEAPVMPKG